MGNLDKKSIIGIAALLVHAAKIDEQFSDQEKTLIKKFIKILENTKERKFKVSAEMMNLLGCTKENFYKLMLYMDYKKDKNIDTYIFMGERKKKSRLIKFDKKENPFNKLLSLNIK